MASITIRNLEDDIKQRLRVRAAEHGRSMEEEARQIISQAVAAPQSISAVFRAHFGELQGVELTLQQQPPHEPMDFEG